MYSTFSLSLKPPPYPKEGGAEIVMIIHQNHLQVIGEKNKILSKTSVYPFNKLLVSKKSITTENSLKVGYKLEKSHGYNFSSSQFQNVLPV